jgi:hypothetical protein
MAENEGVVQAADFQDRKTRLLVFGILQVIFGGFCALMVPFMILGIVMSAVTKKDAAAEGPGLQMIIPGILFYVLLAVWFIWMGIGSIKTKRWARALILVSSWLWLITGTLGFVFMLLFLPAMFDKMGETGQMPKNMAVIMKCVMMASMAVIYVIIPGLLVLFYSGKDVKATCEHRDPHIRWTDRCPLPVLAVTVVCAFWTASLPFTAAYGWVIPFFGVILSGVQGAIAVCVLFLLLIYIARGLYKLDIKAWWCAILVTVGWALSTMITFSLVSMQAFYEKMNFPEQQLEQMNQLGTQWEYFIKYSSVFWMIAVLAYLLYIRRYFTNTSSQASASR